MWRAGASVAVLLGLLTSPIRAQAPSSGFVTHIRPYFWLSGVSGSVTSAPLTFPINSSFGDLLDNVKIGAFAAVTVEKARWGMYGDFQYISLVGGGTGPSGATLELQNVIGEVDGFLRIPAGSGSLKFVLGVRVYSVDETLTPNSQPPVKSNTTVADPILGAVGEWSIGKRWNFEMRGDLGGFGIGSEFTNQLSVVFQWQINDRLRLPFGYRVLGYQINDGGVVMDTRMTGLVVGLDIGL